MALELITNVTDDTFDEQVLKSDLPVIVDFWAPWCGPCRMMAPVLEQLAAEYRGKVRVAKLNTDDNAATAGRYGIMGIPTVLVFKGGENVGGVTGFLPLAALRKRLDPLIG